MIQPFNHNYYLNKKRIRVWTEYYHLIHFNDFALLDYEYALRFKEEFINTDYSLKDTKDDLEDFLQRLQNSD